MKHKTAELEGRLLDAAVATAQGRYIGFVYNVVHGSGVIEENRKWLPSADWYFGGPIVEREGITLFCRCSSLGQPYWLWEAYVHAQFDGGTLDHCLAEAEGRTPLIAAMRAYVTAKLGEEVELP